MNHIFRLGFMLFVTLLLASCAQTERRGFDPAPYLGEAFQRLTSYEQITIEPTQARYIYAEEEGADLAVLFLFVTFTRADDAALKYAMITVYVNPQDETLVNAFIDRIFYDELRADISSAQGFQTLYEAQLVLAEAFPNTTLTIAELTAEVIERAMQGVRAPS